MNAATNALGLVAGLIWLVCGLCVLTRARRAEVSLRALLAFGQLAAGALAIGAARRGELAIAGGVFVLAAAVLTLLVVTTRPGRRAAGLDGIGMTTQAPLDDAPEVR